MEEKIKKFICIILVIFSLVLIGCGASSTTQKFYDKAKIVDMKNGSGTAVIGKVSILMANTNEISMEDLSSWYFNHVEKNECDYYVIVYPDQKTGIYAVKGYVEVNVPLSKEIDGTYTTTGEGTTVYTVRDGKLSRLK